MKKNDIYLFSFKKIMILLFLIVSCFYISQEKFTFAQTDNVEKYNPLSKLLTENYLLIKSNTNIDGSLDVRGPIKSPLFDILSKGQRGRLYTDELTEERRYILPNLSGEICLSAGNCIFGNTGTLNRIVKFTETGFGDSLIFENGGNIGIDTENPLERLHVAGGIKSDGDVCTDLSGGICLSTVREGMENFSDSILDGEGNLSYIPIWKNNRLLGDSVIYQSEDNVGIGVRPTSKLDISGTVKMLGFRLPVNPEKGYGLMSDERGFGTWRPVLTPEGTAADIAERFLIDPICKNNCPEAGDVVSINKKGFIQRSSIAYDSNIIGIISTKPELTLNSTLNQSLSRPVALIGRVPTKVSLENGEINPGDLLTSSSIPGVAMKATESGRVIGISLDSLSSEKNIKKIDVLINPHYYSKKEDLSLIDKKTGEKYCLEIIDGELNYSICE